MRNKYMIFLFDASSYFYDSWYGLGNPEIVYLFVS